VPASLLPGGFGEPRGVCRLRMRFCRAGPFEEFAVSSISTKLSNFQGFGARKIPLGSSVAKPKEIA